MMYLSPANNSVSLMDAAQAAAVREREFAPLFLGLLVSRGISVGRIRVLDLLFEKQSIREGGALLLLEMGSDLLVLADFTAKDAAELCVEETPGFLFQRYLDLQEKERAVLWGVSQRLLPRWVLVATAEGVSLLDPLTERALVRCKAHRSFEDLDALLIPLSFSGSPKAPFFFAEQAGEELRRWSDLFAGHLGSILKWGREDSVRLTRQLLLGFKALLQGGGERALPGFGAVMGDGLLRIAWPVADCLSLVGSMLDAAYEVAPDGAGMFSPLEQRGILRQFETVASGRQTMVLDLFRLSHIKLQAAAQVRMLSPSSNEQTSWRLALLDPLCIDVAVSASDFYVYRPLELVFADCGFGRILEAVEKLAFYALGQNDEIRRLGGRQMDLIEPEPEGLEGDLLRDPFNWLLRHALRIRVDHLQRDLVGYLVASFIMDLRSQSIFSSCRLGSLVNLPYLFARGNESN